MTVRRQAMNGSRKGLTGALCVFSAGPSGRHMACGGKDSAKTHICVPFEIRIID
jgi:hypothetical protein